MARDQTAINVILIHHQSRTVALYPSRKEPKRDGETARYRSDCVRLSSNTASYVNFRPATFTVRSIGRASTTAFLPDDSSVDVSGRTRTPTRTWQEASCVVMAAGRNYLIWVVAVAMASEQLAGTLQTGAMDPIRLRQPTHVFSSGTVVILCRIVVPLVLALAS